jgi:predicted short-subunit dehydrogenase-like oxidoreductase (DUF2520 family)
MTAPPKPRIGILGMGRLGSALAAALPRAGYEVRTGSGRDTAAAQAVVDATDIVVITTADAAVPGVCASLQWRAAQGAVHCGGVLTLDALSAARDAGALPGCLHPLQSFPNGAADANRFHGITFGVEAAAPLDGALERIADDLGGSVVRLEGVDRSLYHAAAILSSNDVVALMAAATRAWILAGLPAQAARAALGPLLTNVAQNVAIQELASALTGPVARGDVNTVERHLAALTVDADLRELYRLLAGELLRLPLSHSPEASAALHALVAAKS